MEYHFKLKHELPPVADVGLGASPRRSDLDTAVILSPEDYDCLILALRYYADRNNWDHDGYSPNSHEFRPEGDGWEIAERALQR